MKNIYLISYINSFGENVELSEENVAYSSFEEAQKVAKETVEKATKKECIEIYHHKFMSVDGDIYAHIIKYVVQ